MTSLKIKFILLVAVVTCEAGSVSVRRKIKTKKTRTFVAPITFENMPEVNSAELNLNRRRLVRIPAFPTVSEAMNGELSIVELLPVFGTPKIGGRRTIRIRSNQRAEMSRESRFGKKFDEGVYCRVGHFIRSTLSKRIRSVRRPRITDF